MVMDFFKSLGRSRVESVKIAAKSKAYSAQARAKGKASSKFNKSVDGAVGGVKDKAKGKVKGKGKKKAPADQQDDKAMGLFRKKGGGGAPQAHVVEEQPQADFGDKTSIFQVPQMERPKECVGWVVVLNGAQKGQDFRLVPGKNMLGTAADCDIVLTDQYMSSRHAVIRFEDGRFTLVDLDSTNGSMVNDHRISKEELIDNDRVRLGRSELKFKSLY